MTTDIVSEAMTRAAPEVGAIDLALIHPNPWQTRVTIDLDGIEALAADILRNGLLQPILVRPIQHGRLYELVFGQRRLRAIQLLMSRDQWFAGIPAQVRDMSDREVLMATLGENTSREDVDTVEESRALARALEQIPELKQSDLADTLGISAGQLSNRLRILRLPDSVLELVSSGRLAWTAARELLTLAGPDHQHDREIETAVERADRNYASQKERRITVERIRDAIVQVCAEQPRKWRPLEKIDGFEGKPVSAPPEFDVETFEADHNSTLHNLPKLFGGRSVVWTCNGREWMRLQRAARVANPPVPKMDWTMKRWVAVMSKHPLVQQVAPEFSHENPVFTPEQEEALGPLARFVKGTSSMKFAVPMSGGWSSPPKYLDQSECRSTCDRGALIASEWVGAVPSLHCTNEECFDTKLREGKERFRTRLAKTVDNDDARQARLADRLARMLPDGNFARGLGQFLIDVVSAEPTAPIEGRYGHHEDRDLNYFPKVKRRAAEALGLETGDPARGGRLWDQDAARTKLSSHEDPTGFTAALLAVALDEVGVTPKSLGVGTPPASLAPVGCADHRARPLYQSKRIPGTNGKTTPRHVRVGTRCESCNEVVLDGLVGQSDDD